MIVSYSQIVGSDVLAIEEQQLIGRIADIVLQKTDLKIKAAVMSSAFFFMPPKVITFDDIVDFDKNAVIVQSSDNVVPLSEVISVEQAVRSKQKGIGQKVYTRSGKFVGKVYDYTIESSNGMIFNLFTKHMLVDRIIPRTAILEYKDNTFIIDDEYEMVRNSATMPEAA